MQKPSREQLQLGEEPLYGFDLVDLLRTYKLQHILLSIN